MREGRWLENCMNCGSPLEESDQFCAYCGQRTHDGKLPLVKMLREFANDQLNIDSKLIYTLQAMIIPGKLTVEYFAGKRKSQINPIRLFFITMIIGLASLQFSGFELDLDDLKIVFGSQNSLQSIAAIDSLETILNKRKIDDADSILIELRSKLNVTGDSIELKIKDSIFILDYFEQKIPGSQKVSRKDFETLSPSELVKKLNVTGATSIYFKQKIKLMKNPSSLVDYIVRNLTWIYLVYIPVIAMVLKLLYIRRKRFFLEHLVFSLHMHTAFIVFLIIAGLLDSVSNSASWIYLLLLFSIYLFIGLKRFYGQGFWKTFLKFIILLITYPQILTVFILIAGLFSLIFF